MKVWIIQVGEPLPSDTGRPRLWRSGLLAQHLSAKGHEVLWWATTFEHRTKSHRAPDDRRLRLDDRLEVQLIHSPGYANNVSLARLRDHRILGRRFRELAEQEATPDVIHCGFPTIELSLEAAEYGRRHRVPVVLDARDLWPEIFVARVPRPLRGLARVMLGTEFMATRRAFSLATAISGHTADFVTFGLQQAARSAGPLDRWFPFGYPTETPQPREIEQADEFWRNHGVAANSPTPVICYLGTLGTQRAIDIGAVIDAARLLQQRQVNVRFVLCGSGPRLAHWRREASSLSNVLLPGWVGYPETWILMRRASAGLLPYLPSQDFVRSIPNKAIEYLSASLPVLTSLTGGVLDDVLRAGNCGWFYRGADPESLAGEVSAMLADPDRTRSMGLRSGELFAREYSADQVCVAMADHLAAVVGAG